MTVIPGAGQPFRRDRVVLRPGPRLQNVEEPESHRLLDLRIAIDFDVRAGPEFVEIPPLLGEEAIPAGEPRDRQRAGDLGLERRAGSLVRPAVTYVLHDPQPGARLDLRGDGAAAQIRKRLGVRPHRFRSINAQTGENNMKSGTRRWADLSYGFTLDTESRTCPTLLTSIPKHPLIKP